MVAQKGSCSLPASASLKTVVTRIPRYTVDVSTLQLPCLGNEGKTDVNCVKSSRFYLLSPILFLDAVAMQKKGGPGRPLSKEKH